MIRFENVSISFNRQSILVGVHFHIKPGEFVSLIGETGVGKTTLLRLIYFDVLPEEGTVTVGEFQSDSIRKKDIPNVRRTLGIVFQDYKLLDDRNVYKNVAFSLEVTGVNNADIGSRTLRVLADVGLSHKRDSMPQELSGGEQQRVVIARALVNQPQIILADEPTGNLDPAASLEILQLLKQINVQGTAVLLASHNYDFVKKSGSRIVQLKEGRITEVESI
ncbi:MAG: ATP-binding cassette domain-containing protein [Ignavibacteriae bacterium]|nr:ATP-binding cassette domain-containing protein [Ignavibacteria bacterium]MBI3365236.1 ATP-binding cassette domain-containing protein [Ignavibacteriota bacterium]